MTAVPQVGAGVGRGAFKEQLTKRIAVLLVHSLTKNSPLERTAKCDTDENEAWVPMPSATDIGNPDSIEVIEPLVETIAIYARPVRFTLVEIF